GEAVGELALEHAEPGSWLREPWWLDACIQVLGAAQEDSDPRMYVPTRIGRLTLHDRPRSDVAWVHARWRRAGDSLEGDLSAHDEGCGPWLELSGIRLQPIGRRRHPIEDSLFTVAWEKRPIENNTAAAPGTWLVLSDGSLGDELIDHLTATGASCGRI